MLVIVCGGRSYSNTAELYSALDFLRGWYQITHVVHGGAAGADTLAGLWAQSRGISVTICWADWKKHGRAAGPIRNAYMLQAYLPSMVVAFPGGTGTEDMVQRARRARVAVWRPLG